VVYDGDGDAHYDTISAFIKSMRGSDPDAALYWLAKMIHAGEDPRFIARRIVICAAEDVGLADPMALVLANAALSASEFVGWPRHGYHSPRHHLHRHRQQEQFGLQAIDAALADVKSGRTIPVPEHLRDTHYKGAERLGHGKGYEYAHDHPGILWRRIISAQTRFITSRRNRREKKIKERLDNWRKLSKKTPVRQIVSQASVCGPAVAKRLECGRLSGALIDGAGVLQVWLRPTMRQRR